MTDPTVKTPNPVANSKPRKLVVPLNHYSVSDQLVGQFDFMATYNLSSDPGEKTNLVDKHPERVARMKAAMEQAIARGRTTSGPDQKNDTEVILVK